MSTSPCGQVPAVDDLLLVHDAHGEAGHVVVLLGHEAGVLGGLPADQGAARLAAALGDAGDDVGDAAGVVFAAGDVVQEKEGGGAAADDIVDAHGHAVDADGVVLVHELGQAQLGAHAVGAGDQHRASSCRRGRGRTARRSPPRVPMTPGMIGGLHHGLDALHRLIAGGHVHARRRRRTRNGSFSCEGTSSTFRFDLSFRSKRNFSRARARGRDSGR